VEFEGAFNVRDLGGLPTTDGSTLQRGRILRADGPRRLTVADRAKVGGLGIGHVIDLRSGAEIEFGSWAVVPSMHTHRLAVIDSLPDMSNPGAELPTLDTPEQLAERYAFRVEAMPERYAEAVAIVARVAHEGVLFHCEAGKDRTGLIAAGVLEAAGVGRANIVADYALSAAGMRRKIDYEQAHPSPGDTNYHRLSPVVATPPAEVMERFLSIMDERHGGYLTLLKATGLHQADIDQLRAALLLDRH